MPWSALLGRGIVLATVLSSNSVLHIVHARLTVFYVSCVCVAQTFLVPIFGNAFRHLFLALCREEAHILGVSTQKDPLPCILHCCASVMESKSCTYSTRLFLHRHLFELF